MSHETGTASSWVDLLKKIHTYLTTKGTAFGLRYTGVGDGLITDLRGGASSVAEQITVTFTGATAFDVDGSVSGSLPSGATGTPYTEPEVEFEINVGSTAFQAGDEFIFSVAPPWISRRAAFGTKNYVATFQNTGSSAAANVFDACGGAGHQDPYRVWGAQIAPSFPVTLEIEYYEAETIAEYALQAPPHPTAAGFMPMDWDLEYWNGSVWVSLDSVAGEVAWGVNEIRTFTVGSPVSATRYRLNITAAASAGGLYISEWFMRRTANGFNTLPSQVIMEAPGNDGDSEIMVGIRQFYRLDADYFNLQFAYMDGFLANNEFYNQPGFGQHSHFMPLLNANMTYWIQASGRHVFVVAKVQTQYECGGAGFYDPFFPPNELAQPMFAAGSMHAMTFGWPWAPGDSTDWSQDTTFRFDQDVTRHAAPTHSDPGSGSESGDPTAHFRSNLTIRRFDGSDQPCWASRNKSYGSFGTVPENDICVIWPLSDGPGDTDPNFDAGYTTFPLQLLSAGPTNPMGQLPGLAWVTGQDISAESVLSDGPRKWVVFPDINRNTREAFFALELY